MPSQIATLTFDHPVNASLQIGDIVYYSTIIVDGGLIISVTYDNSLSPPTTNDYLSFAKDKQVNSSSLVGYYAEAKFINNSKEKAELFSVGSEISESSK